MLRWSAAADMAAASNSLAALAVANIVADVLHNFTTGASVARTDMPALEVSRTANRRSDGPALTYANVSRSFKNVNNACGYP